MAQNTTEKTCQGSRYPGHKAGGESGTAGSTVGSWNTLPLLWSKYQEVFGFQSHTAVATSARATKKEPWTQGCAAEPLIK